MIHYLIFAHSNFDQLKLLVDKIKNENSKIYIHVDGKVNDFPKFKDVYYIKDRQKCYWGGTGILKAEIIGLSEVYKHMKKGDHIVFMSGLCFPIKKVDYIEKNIDSLGNKSSICYHGDKKYEEWVTKYWFYSINLHIPSFINKWLINLIYRFRKFDKNIKVPIGNIIISEIISFILPSRKFIAKNFKIYKGDAWIVLSYDHVKYLLDFLDTNEGKEFLRNYEYTLIPDETFFHTILVNKKKNEIINKCLWYISWGEGNSSPRVLTQDDLGNIKTSDCLFARKFDIRKDKKVIDYLGNL